MNEQVVEVSFDDGIAVLRADHPPVNTITAAVRRQLLDGLQEIGRHAHVQAVVLACAGNTFFSGADIGEFSGPPREEEYRTLLDAFEQLSVPVVAGMHGTVLGGGLEIGLACHYRVAAPGTRLGLPELSLGIFPGAGGTQRMPRLIGVEKTIELVLGARPVTASAAIELGFVDAEIQGDIRVGAIAYARELIASGRGVRRTCDRPVDPATATPMIIERLTAEARRLYPNRTAALTAIEVIAASARLPFRAGLAYETERVNEAKTTVEARALAHVFFAERATRRVADIPAATVARPVAKAGVLGAGTMGGGIAICFANAGLPVTLVDASSAALERGLAGIRRTYESMVRRGRLSAAEQTQRLALIRGSLDLAELADADVLIEAVFEDLELKRRLFTAIDAVAKPGALLATNTSTLDIGAIAAATRRPQDVIGLHFFAPANVMPLLEVVRTGLSSAQTIRTAMELARPLRKTAVLARVCYGFIGNRMMEGYAREAERMLLEGATPRQVDGALEAWGMAMGILAVFDMAGIEVGVNVHRANASRYPPDPTYYQADFALYAAGRLGQKNGKGYYRYATGERTRQDDPEAGAILRATAERLGVAPRAHGDAEIIERCIYPLINEGLRILEEGVAMRAGDVDVVWTAGYGFPRYRGGPLFYADTIGLETVYRGILRYREQFGPMHWEPAPLLSRLVQQGRTLADWERSRPATEEQPA